MKTNENRSNEHKGHRIRLKERFRKEGLDHFEPHNCLELLLFYAIPQRDTNELAHRLINEFGSISGVFNASFEELIKDGKVSENAAILIKLIPELSRVYAQDLRQGEIVLDDSQKTRNYFEPKFFGRVEEVVFAACIDSESKVKCCELIHSGSVSAAAVNVRKIAELAMKYHASGVIIAHNHPNGLAIASNEDIMTTDAINYALKLIGIRLIDHIIVANNASVSLADLGVIK